MFLKFLLLLAVPMLTVSAADKRLRVLILCTGNSARSQMAEGFLKSLDARLEVYSAGTHPSPRVNPLAIEAMKEIGLDISGGTPKKVDQFVSQSFDYVITVCDDADQNCPYFTGKVGKRVHIGFEDPAKTTDLAVFRKVRDQIRERFAQYFEKEMKAKL